MDVRLPSTEKTCMQGTSSRQRLCPCKAEISEVLGACFFIMIDITSVISYEWYR